MNEFTPQEVPAGAVIGLDLAEPVKDNDTNRKRRYEREIRLLRGDPDLGIGWKVSNWTGTMTRAERRKLIRADRKKERNSAAAQPATVADCTRDSA